MRQVLKAFISSAVFVASVAGTAAVAAPLAGYCGDANVRAVGLAAGDWNGLFLGRVVRTDGGGYRAPLVAPYVYAGMPMMAVVRSADGALGFELAVANPAVAREAAERAGVSSGFAFVEQGGRVQAVCRTGV